METSFTMTLDRSINCYLHNHKISQQLPIKAPMLNNKKIIRNQILPIQLKNRLRNKNTAHISHDEGKWKC